METKLTTKDLIGDLENFPIEVVEKMLEKQYKQVNKKDVSVFQEYNRSDIQRGGFRWENTIEGYEFWNDVIYYKKFDRFFERYPKLSKNVYIYGDDKLYENVIKTLERRGGINVSNYIGDGGCLYYIDPTTNYIEICIRDEQKLYNVITSTFEKIEPDKFIIEMTLPEIAEKLGIDVELLRIKK
jgi:hypothetical protein